MGIQYNIIIKMKRMSSTTQSLSLSSSKSQALRTRRSITIPTQKEGPHAIPFILWDDESGFFICDEAIKFLSDIKEEIGVISIVGK